MKKITSIIAILISLYTYAQSDNLKPPCLSDNLIKKLIDNNPEVKLRLETFDKQLSEIKSNGKTAFSIPPSGSITIPVVFYIVHDGTSLTNIPDTQVIDQLTVLNNYFINTGMKFCLATKANATDIPTVNASDVQTTPGIIHVNKPVLSDHSTNSQQALVNTADPKILKERYLRIWVVKSIDGLSSGILGYSMFPNTSQVFDGIVMRYDVLGNRNSNMLANYDQGKVLVHEVGHYLALYHTFEGGCIANNSDCSLDGDRVCDTPPVAAPNFSCVAGTDSCQETPNEIDDIANYMDYGNNLCQNHFSTGQIERMLSVLNLNRNILISSDNILYTRTCGSANLLSATITASDFSPCTSQSTAVSFSALTADSYSWDFGDSFSTSSNQNTATSQTPSHIFTSSANSPYTVTLTVTNSSGELATSTELIYVSDCSPIVNSNSFWYIDSSYGMNFSSGKPVFDPTFPSNNYANVSCGFQDDNSGNLLFYTNKYKVWNNQHVQINSTDLMLNSNNNSNQILIVPKPPITGNTISEYYIFSQQRPQTALTDIGFRYSIVNVNGTTATMGVMKQPIVLSSSYGFDAATDGSVIGTTCISAIKKCDSNDFWIITVLRKGTTSYIVVFSLTNAGLVYNNERVISDVSGINGDKLKVSPNGNKIFFGTGTKGYIFDFDKADGLISINYTLITIPQTSLPTYGQIMGDSFSPDSNLLYLTDYFAKKIYQFNINSIDINNTRKEIASTIDGPWSLQLGPDNKLYVSMSNSSNNYDKLSVIHNPNTVSTIQKPNACDFSINGPKPIINTFRVGPSLPNIIDAKQETAYFDANTPNVISKYITGCNAYKFFPNICGTSFVWTFTNTTTGTSVTSTDTDPNYTFPANGIYTVELKDNNNVVIGTLPPIIITGVPTPLILGSSTACLMQPNANVTNNSTALGAGETAVWSITGGAGNITGPNNQSSIDVNWTALPGTITLTITDVSGCTATNTYTISEFCSPLSTSTFSKEDIIVVPNPSKGLFNIYVNQLIEKLDIQVIDISGRVVFKETNKNINNNHTIDLTNFQSGIYVLKISGLDFNYYQKIIKN